MFIDGKSKIVNFCNIFYTFKLEYNFLSVGIINKAGYSILIKKEKMTVLYSNDNIDLETTKIGTSYLVNVSVSERTLTLACLHSVSYVHTS